MKKINLLGLLFLLLTCSSLSFGNAVSVNTAKTVGYNYLAQHGGTSSLTGKDDLNLVYTSGGTTPFFYVFSGQHCFVIVSAEDGVTPVIGYGQDRPFDGNHVPKTVTGFFENYNKQISYVISNHVAASPEIASSWSNLASNRTDRHSGEKTTVVTPLLSTTWSQSPYYNADCPYDAGAGDYCVTGCVATATSQIMKFWNWPATGTGTHSYSTSSYGTLSANFGTTTYNWSSMPNAVTSPNAAVARLMSDVGISINMDYSPTESSAYVISSSTGTAPYCAEYSLKNFFGYDASLHGEQRADYDDPTWISMIEADLNAGRPVLYAGFGTAGGHCFVFDGYNSTDMMHVNWGWEGSGPDGYYAIDALNPPSLGTGGGGGGFNSDQQAVFGIKPNGTVVTPASLSLYDYVTPSPSSIYYTQAFTTTTSVANFGTTDFSGDFCAAAFDASGAFVTYIDSAIGVSIPVGYYYPFTFNSISTGILSMVAGNYTIGIFYRSPGGGWIAVSDASPYTNFAPFTVTNSAPIELYSAMAPSPATYIQGAAASVNLNVYNAGSTDFSGSYEAVLLNLDGTLAATIQVMSGMSLPMGDDYTAPYLTFSTSSLTAAPGSYLLTFAYNDGTGWYYGGSDYYENPVPINVIAPPLSPDAYEVNNTAATAYDLTSTLTWTSGTAHTSTPGSNFHIVTDQDYYKVTFAPGYNYTISARVNDILSTDDGLTYTIDAEWSYSTNGGATWSSVYDATMPGTINLTGSTGGTVIFHCSPKFAGSTGSYLLKLGSITRTSTTTSLPDVNLDAAKIYPNPASQFITVDLSSTNILNAAATLTDVQGKKVFSSDMTSQTEFVIPVSTLTPGIYFLQVSTDGGVINKKITVGK